MRRCNHFYNVPESKEDCDETVCQECEHMRELLVEGSEYQECFNENKKLHYINSVKME